MVSTASFALWPVHGNILVSTAIDLSLDLDEKILPGALSTCGVLRCVEDGSEPRLSHIYEMTVFKTSSSSLGARGRSIVGTVSERRPGVSTLWNGVKVDGTWSKQSAQISLYLVERDDCRSTEFSCEVRYVDGLGGERVGSAQIGKAARPQSIETRHVGVGASQLMAMIQQTNYALENARVQLDNRLEDNLRNLENRMEDKIGDLGKDLLKLESKVFAKGGNVEDRTSLSLLEEQVNSASRLFGKVAENVSILQGNMRDILQESVSIVGLLQSLSDNHTEDIHSRQYNDSQRALHGLLDMLASGDLIRADKTAPKKQPKFTQENFTCDRRNSRYIVASSSEYDTPLLCDGHTDGGGWIVIQRRNSGGLRFYRNWAAYRDGFGSLADEFWMGNERIHRLTSQAAHELMVSLEYEGKTAFAHYETFALGDEASNYTLELGTYSNWGTAGDSLGRHRNMPFSTYDADHDTGSGNCAKTYLGAWWYEYCHSSNLNGKWGAVGNKGPRWEALTGEKPVTFSEMKIRRL